MTDPLLLDVPAELTTERLRMRTPSAGDGATVWPLVTASLPELKPWMPWATDAYDATAAEVWCRRAAGEFLLRRQLQYLVLTAGGEYVGNIGAFAFAWDVPECEVGYWLGTPFVGRGYMTEAVGAMTRLAFDTLAANRIVVRTDGENGRSRRVAERCGFTLEGTFRGAAGRSGRAAGRVRVCPAPVTAPGRTFSRPTATALGLGFREPFDQERAMPVQATVGMIGLCLLVVGSTAGIAFADDHRPAPPPPAPTPQLSPEQVVKVVMAALKANDANDDGIRITFAFASPDNQKVTGPVERFIPMVKNPAYAPLVNHQSSSVKELVVKGDQAAEMVTVIDAAGNVAHYVFQLSKQHDAGPLKDCWMTDGVIRVEPKADEGHTA